MPVRQRVSYDLCARLRLPRVSSGPCRPPHPFIAPSDSSLPSDYKLTLRCNQAFHLKCRWSPETVLLRTRRGASPPASLAHELGACRAGTIYLPGLAPASIIDWSYVQLPAERAHLHHLQTGITPGLAVSYRPSASMPARGPWMLGAPLC
ncbi:hypothetical protein BV25DRAFT_996476 [Artomyces pyxidatus]|uniref:Uncharacterized protein n=1 Tax=Artomyces pyxidatus TaxID=48021 RepID=A0ACB8SU78_9AGAM|nr:hypothetical protein BV25DRAFT_996476 [Artomyces pyxidatus]